jgi:hypothetical protein
MDGAADIAAKFAEAMRAGKVRHYEKKGQVDIRPAVAGEKIETVIDGEHETVNTAAAGDYVARGLKGELYIINAEALAKRYGEPLTAPDREGYRRYPAKGDFYGFRYEGAPFKFVAPWKEDMIANPGDYIGTHAMGSNEYYRIERSAFAATYAEATGLAVGKMKSS